MKVPASSPQTNKPTSCTTTTAANSRNISFQTNTSTPNLCDEPTSVLDLSRSPSPTSGKPAPPTSTTDHLLQWEEHVLQNLDWDSIMRELDVVHDDSAPPRFPQFEPAHLQNQITTLPDFPPPNYHHHLLDHNNNNQFLHSDFNENFLNNLLQNQNLSPIELSHHNFHNYNNNHHNFSSVTNFDFIQELIKAADCFDSNQLQLAQAILDPLNQRLPFPTGKPLQRAAFFFKEALHSLLTTGSTRCSVPSSDQTVVNTIKAYKAFFSISPIPMFTDFTTNQALLDSLHHSSSPPFLHVIDFDIGLGCQYASLMQELVEKANVSNFRKALTNLRITAVVQEDTVVENKLMKERLCQFAQELKIRFHIDFVLMLNFEILSFKAVNFVEGEKTAVLLSPTIFRRLGKNASMFLNDLRRVSPNVIVFVDNEGWWAEGGGGSAISFRRNFVNCLEFYSVMFESLDAAFGAGGDWVRRQIEMYLLKPRMFAAVEGCGRRGVAQPWREVFCGAGMRAVQLSQFADFQAESLLGKVQVRGFYVAKRQAELVLCWHDRPLIATSAWKC